MLWKVGFEWSHGWTGSSVMADGSEARVTLTPCRPCPCCHPHSCLRTPSATAQRRDICQHPRQAGRRQDRAGSTGAVSD